MRIVPMVGTPKSLGEIALALGVAYQRQFGRPLGRVSAELLAAQILLETGMGKSVKNNSPGNISASAKWAGDAWRPPWFEPAADASPRVVVLHEKMLRGEAPSAFRSFATFADGMTDYLRTLKSTFPQILQAATPAQLAQAIWDSRYTRDHTPDETTPTLTSLVGKVREAGVFASLEDHRSLVGGLEALAFVVGLVGVIKIWGKVQS